MKMYEFRLSCHWRLSLNLQLTIFQHWFRKCIGVDQATGHYLNQSWLVYWRIYASLGRMRCRVFQKYPVHRLVTKLPAHRHAAFWNARHAVICRAFQKWLLNASSRDSGRYVDAVLKHTATPKIHQMASRFKTFIIPSLREIWGTSSTKRW